MKKIITIFLIVSFLTLVYGDWKFSSTFIFSSTKNDIKYEIFIIDSKKDDKGPPPWAPAHGYRVKYQYYYYPNSQVYYDSDRGLYFYYSNENWEFSVSLPSFINLDKDISVILEMDADKPYIYHSEIVKRYPPKAKNK
ncbi:hypothetical protein [Petrotoga sp. 9PWA.NaAc.5.4]|uniref:hypothetical protein n=1 Tax=Petrotoga sp. 9PWA.NaAc.5.4 TaxID=1434328 RepID=UPI000CCB60C2|nr:hypothetical protein [Petrotoga sp. 9PWA.NaAc.5.4]PNR92857.1 hypothetical protein X924_08710 [Petrotoga sp. 9PWA.NaAc.5.4]